LLGVPNGVVDLRDGSLRRALPDEKVTMRARVPYDPAATCPLWERTLHDIFTFESDDDLDSSFPLDGLSDERAKSLVEFLQRALGYSLTGDVREECFFICWGTGRNGKGTIINLIYWLLGDYADNLSMGTLEEHAFRSGGSPRPDIAKLPGKRMVTASENNKTATLDEEMIKRVTGRDPVTVRQLYKPEFTFDPVFKLWLMVNNKPEGIREDDVALWARIHLIPFLRSFDGCADTTLKDRLKLEAQGILSWAVRGAIDWQERGLAPPPIVRAATLKYRSETDQLAPFFESVCVTTSNVSSKSGDLLRSYQRWCGGLGQQPSFNHKTFLPALIARGFSIDQSKPKQFTWIKGIGLRDEGGRT
jgi:putative DNA primase/helicase